MSTVRRGGTTVFWEEQGSGDAVLLTMGHAFDSRMWHRVTAALAPHYRVIVFDNRGVGRTQWDGQPFGIPDLAQDALTVLDAAGVDKAHVYGASMGGLTAQALALDAPERVRGLVLACTGALGQDATPPHQPLPLKLALKVVPRSLIRRLTAGGMVGPRADKRLVAEDQRIIRSTTLHPGGLEAQGVAVAGYRSKELLGGITAPTLVIHGTADKVVPCVMGEELSRLIPGSRFVALEEAGHNYLVDVGTPANQVVLDFLADIGSRV